jgi:transcriptional regulator with XRE-family HTH domain
MLKSKKEVGELLHVIRKQKYGTLRQFEQASGVSRGTVGPIEKGESYPALDTLNKWVSACGISLSEFVAKISN